MPEQPNDPWHNLNAWGEVVKKRDEQPNDTAARELVNKIFEQVLQKDLEAILQLITKHDALERDKWCTELLHELFPEEPFTGDYRDVPAMVDAFTEMVEKYAYANAEHRLKTETAGRDAQIREKAIREVTAFPDSGAAYHKVLRELILEAERRVDAAVCRAAVENKESKSA
jgi:hypothetical protein